MEATRSRHGWLHMFITHRPTLTLQLYTFICSGHVIQLVSALLRVNWQDFNWHDASRCPLARLSLLFNSLWWGTLSEAFWKSRYINHQETLSSYSKNSSKFVRQDFFVPKSMITFTAGAGPQCCKWREQNVIRERSKRKKFLCTPTFSYVGVRASK